VPPKWLLCAIRRVDWTESQVHVTVTRAQIQTSPASDSTRPVERAYETQLNDHYGHPRCWDGDWNG